MFQPTVRASRGPRLNTALGDEMTWEVSAGLAAYLTFVLWQARWTYMRSGKRALLAAPFFLIKIGLLLVASGRWIPEICHTVNATAPIFRAFFLLFLPGGIALFELVWWGLTVVGQLKKVEGFITGAAALTFDVVAFVVAPAILLNIVALVITTPKCNFA